MRNINEMTDGLLEDLEKARDRFLKSEKPNPDRAFFHMVEEEVNPVFEILDQWAQKMYEQIREENTSLHPEQIDATKENMQSFILHSYYKDTRKRRFIEIYKSCYYIFTQCKKEHENER